MITSDKGLALIKRFEGFRAEAYKCPAGVWTIGYGHTYGVKEGDRVSEEYATELLRKDVASAEAAVNTYVNSVIGQSQFDALVSFVFNCGSGNFRNSTLLKVVNSTPRSFAEVRRQFMRWNKAGGKVLPGLTRRREAEADMYCECDNVTM